MLLATLLGAALPGVAGATLEPSKTQPPATAQTAAPAGKKGVRPLTLAYGDDHCFGFVTPEGWVADDTSGLGSRIRMVLYPRGQKWSSAKTVMYVNPIHKNAAAPRTLDQIIDGDLKAFQQHTPGGVVTRGDPIHTAGGHAAELRLFSTTGARVDEAVAYVEEEPLVMLLVLTSRTPESFARALPAYRQWVASYRFIVGNIDTPTQPSKSTPVPAAPKGATPPPRHK